MLYTYPSNKMDNLVQVLMTLMRAVPSGVFDAEDILVQHPGMKRWLSMSIAQQSESRVCMNVNFPLPVRYFWELIRSILGPDVIPERSPYSREILVWRIYRLLENPELSQHKLMAEPSYYWQRAADYLQTRRRFQLAEQIADLYEQYLMYRPDWITDWEAGETEHWQALLWQYLVADDPNHPLALLKQAVAQVAEPAAELPNRFYLFGINTLAPLWLDFLHVVGEQSTDIHVLYLNPSAEHWDNLLSDKQRIGQQLKAAARARWIEHAFDDKDPVFPEATNPLLASFGRQGQAFVKLLSERAHVDTSAFSEEKSSTTLTSVQNDILLLHDARANPTESMDRVSMDSSICVTSAHSALREVQGLHDWLLHQFNEDSSLTPKDVLVMCPKVEDYAAFAQAIFSRQPVSMEGRSAALPCSIADRNLKDSDATVAAFLELLTLPDARFEVNQIISWLRVPAIAQKFDIQEYELDSIMRWLKHANVHWGLDSAHKSRWVTTATSEHFTWRQGLERLLLGFAYGDEESYVNGQVFMPDVEGDHALILGKLIALIDELANACSSLAHSRTPTAWQAYLANELKIALLASSAEFARSEQTILTAIADITEFANRAGLGESEIPLSVVHYLLEQHFAKPEQTGGQFLAGQINFCSMVPMRSIPFRVIAILGLNDGEFPRQRVPMGFDLMEKSPPRLGDRSRRGDDRYLFLEAILSAKDKLYLSFQGADARTNEIRPPSLVLKEFVDYLSQAHGYKSEKHLRQLPLQPHSSKNYQGEFPSFQQAWLQPYRTKEIRTKRTLATLEIKTDWQIEEWLNAFSHPARFYANERLGLSFQTARQELDDAEPFALTYLDRYEYQQTSVSKALSHEPSDDLAEFYTAKSAWPTHPHAKSVVSQWQQNVETITDLIASETEMTLNTNIVNFSHSGFQLTGLIPQAGDKNLHWRLANANGRDLLKLWFSHLTANTKSDCQSVFYCRGKKGTSDTFEKLTLQPTPNSGQRLANYFDELKQRLSTPVFLHGDLLAAYLRDQLTERTFQKLWHGDNFSAGLMADLYHQYLLDEPPDFTESLARLDKLFAPLKAQLTIEVIE